MIDAVKERTPEVAKTCPNSLDDVIHDRFPYVQDATKRSFYIAA